jgi:hypothetical protein
MSAETKGRLAIAVICKGEVFVREISDIATMKFCRASIYPGGPLIL